LIATSLSVVCGASSAKRRSDVGSSREYDFCIHDSVFCEGIADIFNRSLQDGSFPLIRDEIQKILVTKSLNPSKECKENKSCWEFITLLQRVWDIPYVMEILFTVILMLFLPYLVCFMGFCSVGVAAGSFASWWQSLYGGAVVSGSLFSLLQSWAATGNIAYAALLPLATKIFTDIFTKAT
jgi:hypothetical protein